MWVSSKFCLERLILSKLQSWCELHILFLHLFFHTFFIIQICEIIFYSWAIKKYKELKIICWSKIAYWSKGFGFMKSTWWALFFFLLFRTGFCFFFSSPLPTKKNFHHQKLKKCGTKDTVIHSKHKNRTLNHSTIHNPTVVSYLLSSAIYLFAMILCFMPHKSLN